MIDPSQMKDSSYIYVLIAGTPAILEFHWDTKKSFEHNKEVMRKAIIDQVLWPVKQLKSCD